MHVIYTAEQLEIQPLLAAANINPESFLATDYLNHFNEIVMLLEMIPDMPELLEDATEWLPKGYEQHFADSGFQAKALAIKAYALAPHKFRDAFERLCADMNSVVKATLDGLMMVNIAERGMSDAAKALVRGRVSNIQEMLMKLNQIIHGKFDEATIAQNDVIKTKPEEVQSQEDIDKLFD